MAIVKIFTVLALVAVASSLPTQEHYSSDPYSFKYAVEDHHTGDHKAHHESREGGVVKGYYTLKEADGTVREVHYTADKHNGFNAVVKTHGTPHEFPYKKHHSGPVEHVHKPTKFYNLKQEEPKQYQHWN